MQSKRASALIALASCIFLGVFLQHDAQRARAELAIATPLIAAVERHDEPRCATRSLIPSCDVMLSIATPDGGDWSIAVDEARGRDAARAALQRYPLRSRVRAYAITTDGVTRYIGEQTYKERQTDARGLLSWTGLLVFGGALISLLALIFPNLFLWRR